MNTVRLRVETILPDEPRFFIGEAARLVDLHPQTLRHYEDLGLVVPKRTPGNIRLYSPHDIERLRKIARLTQELGVNLAGVRIILRLTEQVEELRTELTRVEASVTFASVRRGQ
jgi:MerR family transcriptional regulator/heat shock protein HspR